MKHTSVPLEAPIEIVDMVPLNPLISKCQIKVCYVGNEPNRNRSIITKATAKEIARSIPGSPIVGYYDPETEDFSDHSEIFEITDDGEIKFSSLTKPYGFVDIHAQVWFQKFLDDGVNEHEYLMTEGYLWTGRYPEAQRVLDTEENNQSMELDRKTLNGFWSEDNKSSSKFFIINEAIMSALCILGEDCEPCFEGAGLKKTYTDFNFRLNDSFKQELFSLVGQMKEILDKGGAPVFTKYSVEIGDSLWTSLYEAIDKAKYKIHGFYSNEDNKPFAVLYGLENEKFYKVNFSNDSEFSLDENFEDITDSYSCEAQFSDEAVQAFYTVETEVETEEVTYNLEEIPEYVELKGDYDTLQSNYSTLEKDYNTLKTEVEGLRAFRLAAENKEKQAMIDSFYMLSDEDKKDVIENMNTYSLDDIEAKLSIICVRNKVSFNLEEEEDNGLPTNGGAITYNLGGDSLGDPDTPAWVKALESTAKSMQ